MAAFNRPSPPRRRVCDACHEHSPILRIEKKRKVRARMAAREGRAFRPGLPGRSPDPARKAALAEAKAQALAQRKAEQAALIAAKPWLDPSLTDTEKYAMQYRLDPEYNLSERLRAAFRRRRQGHKIGDLLREALKRDGSSPSVERFVGYTVAQLKVHLERQFTKGMSWDVFCEGDIHIDHVRPISSFDVSNLEELKAAWALSNLRPLWATDNLAKGQSITLLI